MTTPPPFDAIIFDMDGVLFDSEAIHVRAWAEMGQRHDLGFDSEWVRGWIGRPDVELVACLRERHNGSRDLDSISQEKLARFIELTTLELQPFAGLVERLAQLRADGRPIAICTSTTTAEARRMLAATGLAPYFETMVAAEDVSRHKPAPDAYLEAARRLELTPDRCAVIEDSPTGVAAARAAGCLTIAVTTSFAAAELAAADHVMATTVEALDWLSRSVPR